MCLILEKDSVKTVAHTDIVVYKAVVKMSHTIKQASYGFLHSETYYRSLLFDFDYEKDVVYCSELLKTVSLYTRRPIIEQGFHSFACIEDAKRSAENYFTVVKCIIPAGSEFYKGQGIDFTPQYASNKIMVKEEVKL